MPRFVAMLRGINLGSHNRIAMPALKEAFESTGFTNVASYLQSGNIAFNTTRDASADVVQELIKNAFGLEVPVIVRQRDEITALIVAQPFASDPPAWHVTFLGDDLNTDAPTTGNVGDDRWKRIGRDVYLEIPASYGLTKLSNAYFEKLFGTTATTRNWKTVTALADL